MPPDECAPGEGLSEDMLVGGFAISEYLFGSRRDRRRVYALADSGRLPIFRLGNVLCARKSTLRAYISKLETSL